MTRRISLPGADELFRKTTLSAVPDQVEVVEEVVHTNRPTTSTVTKSQTKNASGVRQTPRRKPTGLDKGPSGREKHDEKITVYLSPEELFDLEQARLHLRGDLGLAVDRGRIVREALSIVIADLEAKGDQSIIARRLRGR
ncbi:MAG: hypothetical protein ACO243_00550 [Candidatus Nanopelagicaceae bacterium]|jgi:hypothetical protein|nr:hypothetical protein [Actinomycetota bacterium]NCV44130.1 hypothetical protein [Actinomycetota bacterium]NCV83699.1 hypothetical protein [Actinomycetota bacterium]NCV95924.1 hypothetical protein [Actinomycetota bacterium]NCW46666.1 hypothetical protein [Actinomycetota bacterium]